MAPELERLAALVRQGDLAAADTLAGAARRGSLDVAPSAWADLFDPVADALLVVLAEARGLTRSPIAADRVGERWVALDFPVARALVTLDTERAHRNPEGHAGAPDPWAEALRWLATPDGAEYIAALAATAAVHDPAAVQTAGHLGDGGWVVAALDLATAVWIAEDGDGPYLCDGQILHAARATGPATATDGRSGGTPHWRLGFAGGLFVPDAGKLDPIARYVAARSLASPTAD